jgi:hypothetical protein
MNSIKNGPYTLDLVNEADERHEVDVIEEQG